MNDVSRASRAPGHEQGSWRGPTVAEIAKVAGLGTATVDRVLNRRGGVREKTRQQVLDALRQLESKPNESKVGANRRRVAFLSESGMSFNQSLEQAVAAQGASRDDVECSFTGIATVQVGPNEFAELIERTAETADGLIVVAREALATNRAIRAVATGGVPVVCMTTDLPGSNRVAYVGSDQTSAGATAAYLMGRVVGERKGKILLVISAPFRCQEERELGFRRVLRSEFAHLEVDERINSNDEPECSYRSIRDYIAEHGPPVGVYNVAAGNIGVARALEEEGLKGKVVFIGHELNANSRMLLESGAMDFAIGHDLDREVLLSIGVIEKSLRTGAVVAPAPTKVRIFTKYSCN